LLHHLLIYLIALVWLINGLYCKVLHQVPRHREIVGRILGESHADTLTLLIGLGEMLMAIWIFSRIKPTWCAWAQIMLIGSMNILEFFLVPDLLLWGRLNILFALLFILLIYYVMIYRSNQSA
jgi:DoxX-like family